ncbi:hypothetical protein [Calothrix sp. NIES-2100]
MNLSEEYLSIPWRTTLREAASRLMRTWRLVIPEYSMHLHREIV